MIIGLKTANLYHGPLQKPTGALHQQAYGLDSANQIDNPNFGTMKWSIRFGLILVRASLVAKNPTESMDTCIHPASSTSRSFP
jgi:hypothetical protein